MTDRYCIVALTDTDYDAFIRAHRLPPGQCFQCATTAEAYMTSWRNAAHGIETSVMWTPEFDQESPIGRRTA